MSFMKCTQLDERLVTRQRTFFGLQVAALRHWGPTRHVSASISHLHLSKSHTLSASISHLYLSKSHTRRCVGLSPDVIILFPPEDHQMATQVYRGNSSSERVPSLIATEYQVSDPSDQTVCVCVCVWGDPESQRDSSVTRQTRHKHVLKA